MWGGFSKVTFLEAEESKMDNLGSSADEFQKKVVVLDGEESRKDDLAGTFRFRRHPGIFRQGALVVIGG